MKFMEPPIMEPESVVNLFDSFWFYGLRNIETQNKTSISSTPEPIPQRQSTVNTKSNSENPIVTSPYASTVSTDISSPNTVLFKPHLKTVLSESELILDKTPELKKPRGAVMKKTKRALSKSLSELEFEELKGFMDLGFVFTEEDKVDSDLLEIIPGLQRLGAPDSFSDGTVRKIEEKIGESSGARARPYLSEAWEEMEKKRKMAESPLMKWRVPATSVGNEIDMKDGLKWWAHTVASAVR